VSASPFAGLPWRVLVVGESYDVEVDECPSVRSIRDAALRAHGIVNVTDTAAIDASWEVRDSAGLLRSPDQEMADREPLFVHRKPGWGG
jgi:hypothetical protein